MNKVFEQSKFIFCNGFVPNVLGNETTIKIISWNTSEGMPMYYIDTDIEKEMQAFRNRKIMRLFHEISMIINLNSRK